MSKTLTTKSIACSAPYGSGGLGRHFTQIVEQARQESIAFYYRTVISVPTGNWEAILERLVACQTQPLQRSLR